MRGSNLLDDVGEVVICEQIYVGVVRPAAESPKSHSYRFSKSISMISFGREVVCDEDHLAVLGHRKAFSMTATDVF
jgi:hypothetical protein